MKLELNIALMPAASLAGHLAKLSNELAGRYRAVVQLSANGYRLSLAPHLTLYQVPIFVDDMRELAAIVAGIAGAWPPQQLAASGYLYNEAEASLEVGYEATEALVAMQEKVIAQANPLRGDILLEHDPGGNDPGALLRAGGKLGDNIRSTGYAEVGDPRAGGLFRPHATLNWFELGTKFDIAREKLPASVSLSGTFTTLGIFTLGPQGTCPQLLASYGLAGKNN